MGRVRCICESYDSNPTRLTIKKKKKKKKKNLATQPNIAGWVGSGRFWQVSYTPLLNLMSLLSLNDVAMGQTF